jgi:hypothetical protein
MYRRAVVSLICVVVLFPAVSVRAQALTGSAPQPIVTAENEPWYLSGEPLTYEGNFYYPVGPLTAFNRNEMVRSGFFRGIPLYARTTYEPWSVVFVPLPGGFMQPYVRRRSGEIAGTIGSIGPGLPVERDDTSRALTDAPQMAAGPPTNLPDTPIAHVTAPVPSGPIAVGSAGRLEQERGATGAAGTIAAAPAPGRGGVLVLTRPRPLVTAARSTGVDGVYVEFDSARWYSSGSSVELAASFRRVGEYHGFPVYVRGDESSTIYIPIASNVRAIVAPYSKRR